MLLKKSIRYINYNLVFRRTRTIISIDARYALSGCIGCSNYSNNYCILKYECGLVIEKFLCGFDIYREKRIIGGLINYKYISR
jgi:hypothetical protein